MFLNINYLLSSLFNIYSNCCWSLFANEITYHHFLALSYMNKLLHLIQLLFSSTICIICNNKLICGLPAWKVSLLSSILGTEQEGKEKETQLDSTRAALKPERSCVWRSRYRPVPTSLHSLPLDFHKFTPVKPEAKEIVD